MDPAKENRTWYRKRIEGVPPSKSWWLRQTLYYRKQRPDIPIEEIHELIISAWEKIPQDEKIKLSAKEIVTSINRRIKMSKRKGISLTAGGFKNLFAKDYEAWIQQESKIKAASGEHWSSVEDAESLLDKAIAEVSAVIKEAVDEEVTRLVNIDREEIIQEMTEDIVDGANLPQMGPDQVLPVEQPVMANPAPTAPVVEGVPSAPSAGPSAPPQRASSVLKKAMEGMDGKNRDGDYIESDKIEVPKHDGRYTFIDDPEDMAWLRDTLLPKLDKSFNSAQIFGNEDSPDFIQVFHDVEPEYTDPGIIWERNESAEEDMFEEFIKQEETDEPFPIPLRLKESTKLASMSKKLAAAFGTVNKVGQFGSQDIWKSINWMDRQVKVDLLEQAGFAVYDNEDMSDIDQALFSAIESGDVALPDEHMGSEYMASKKIAQYEKQKEFDEELKEIENELDKEGN